MLLEMGQNPDLEIIGVDISAENEVPHELMVLLKGYYACDLSDPDQVRELAQKVIEEHPDLEMAVCNAGIKAFGKVLKLDQDLIRRTLNVNVFAPIVFSKAFFSTFKRFTLVIMGSNSSFAPHSGTAVYGATKVAVNAFAEGLAHELEENQQIISLCPSLIATDEYNLNNPGNNMRYRQPIDLVNALYRIIDGREKRTIVPVITRRLRIKYFLFGMAKNLRHFRRKG